MLASVFLNVKEKNNVCWIKMEESVEDVWCQ